MEKDRRRLITSRRVRSSDRNDNLFSFGEKGRVSERPPYRAKEDSNAPEDSKFSGIMTRPRGHPNLGEIDRRSIKGESAYSAAGGYRRTAGPASLTVRRAGLGEAHGHTHRRT